MKIGCRALAFYIFKNLRLFHKKIVAGLLLHSLDIEQQIAIVILLWNSLIYAIFSHMHKACFHLRYHQIGIIHCFSITIIMQQAAYTVFDPTIALSICEKGNNHVCIPIVQRKCHVFNIQSWLFNPSRIVCVM